jgi:hypothetical protein
MSITKTTVVVDATVWECNFCGRTAAHTEGTGAPLTTAFFIETLRWVQLSDTVVSCDRCRVHADLLNNQFADALLSLR